MVQEKEETVDTSDVPESESSILNLIKKYPDCHNGKWCQNEVRAEKDKNKEFTHYQNFADMELDKETFGLDGGYESGIEEDKSEASEIGFETNEQEAFVEKDEYHGLHYACERWKRKVNEFLRKDIEGERQNEENYNLNDLERPDSIFLQADIMKRSTEIELTEEVLDVGTTSGIETLEHCRQRGIEVKKDAFKDYERLTEPILDKEAEGPEYYDEVGIGFETDEPQKDIWNS
ncbi:hypothetical protein F8M41_022508 [Gigaspora margarita]|uniref:Uncharacterized protein n=1 Tax=Gigaspora margarita TaxID=4874 RepID=A0A8H4EVG2_GIGMA|nr:hypothetical protein F8M41_022508 [Gigaspora margarita]